MSLSYQDRIGAKFMLAFRGTTVPEEVAGWIRTHRVAGYSLFRGYNYDNPAQVRALTADLQALAHEAGHGPLLIATDQEGGQLTSMGAGTTQFAGNMALAATRDAGLAQRVGQAIGRELAAMGINVNYAPVSDLSTNPANPVLGIRAFSDDPALAAEMVAATVTGLQSAGVAAALKHFPGTGHAAVDSHYQMPVITHDRDRLDRVELPPFRAGIERGAKLVMTGHFAIPALSGSADLPATISRAVMHDFIRDEMGFDGVVITDALDMGAITQGAGQIVDVIAALRAGVDLLLLMPGREEQERLYGGLLLAYTRGLIDDSHLTTSVARIAALQRWAGDQPQPDLSVVGCAEHRALEAELARRSITLVRDAAGLLPLAPEPGARIAALMPQPQDLTPADTSSMVAPALAEALRAYHPQVDEFIFSQRPDAAEIAALRDRVRDYDLLVLGTINTLLQPEQAALARELLGMDVPAVTVALRTPYDLTTYPQAATHLCTYSIQPASLQALAAVLFGQGTAEGQLPVQVSLPAQDEE
jgi:beta-N-acetylhexosaminidase